MTAFGLGGKQRAHNRPFLCDSVTWLALRICQADQPRQAQQKDWSQIYHLCPREALEVAMMHGQNTGKKSTLPRANSRTLKSVLKGHPFEFV